MAWNDWNGLSLQDILANRDRKVDPNLIPRAVNGPQVTPIDFSQQQQKKTDVRLGEGVGGTAGGLIGSIWGPIGSFAGKKIGKEVGGGIQEVVTSKQPLTDLSHRFLLKPMQEALNPQSTIAEAIGVNLASSGMNGPTGMNGPSGITGYSSTGNPYSIPAIRPNDISTFSSTGNALTVPANATEGAGMLSNMPTFGGS